MCGSGKALTGKGRAGEELATEWMSLKMMWERGCVT